MKKKQQLKIILWDFSRFSDTSLTVTSKKRILFSLKTSDSGSLNRYLNYKIITL